MMPAPATRTAARSKVQLPAIVTASWLRSLLRARAFHEYLVDVAPAGHDFRVIAMRAALLHSAHLLLAGGCQDEHDLLAVLVMKVLRRNDNGRFLRIGHELDRAGHAGHQVIVFLAEIELHLSREFAGHR